MRPLTHLQSSDLYTLLALRNTLLHDFALDYWFDIEHEYRNCVETAVYTNSSIATYESSNVVPNAISMYKLIQSLKAQVSCLISSRRTGTNLTSVLTSILQDSMSQLHHCDLHLYHKVQHLLCLAHSSQTHKDIVLSFRGHVAETVLCVIMETVSYPVREDSFYD